MDNSSWLAQKGHRAVDAHRKNLTVACGDFERKGGAIMAIDGHIRCCVTRALLAAAGLCVAISAPRAHAALPQKSEVQVPTGLTEHSYPALGAGIPNRVDVAWNRYYDHAGLTAIFEALHRAFPQQTQLYSIGKSQEGRELWCLELSGATGTPNSRKPGMYIDANTHGNEVQGGEAVAYTAWYLLHAYDRVARVKELVDNRVFYLIASINPDGRDAWLTSANSPHSSRTGAVPVDNDKDGLIDEDDAEDLDGDGAITWMRIADDQGAYKPHPDFPEFLTVRVEPGEVGSYTFLGSEGIDNDGDGRINEDGKGGYDPNRNWPWDWQPENIQRGAHAFPFSLPESHAIAQFVVSHPNVAGMQSFHNAGGMILRGPGRANGVVAPDDDAIMATLARRGEVMLPFYKSMVTHADLYTVWGGETDWFYAARGIFAFTNELWTNNNLLRRSGEVTDKDRVEFVRDLLMGEGLVPWKAFDHPTYGRVEIGGSSKLWGRVPPSFMLEEELHRNMMFTLMHADALPQLAWGETTTQKLGGGVTRVVVAIRNERQIPSRSQQEVRNRITRPDVAMLTGPSVKVLSSGLVVDRFRQVVEASSVRPERIFVESVPGLSTVYVAFLVSGSGVVELVYDSAKGGKLSRKIRL